MLMCILISSIAKQLLATTSFKWSSTRHICRHCLRSSRPQRLALERLCQFLQFVELLSKQRIEKVQMGVEPFLVLASYQPLCCFQSIFPLQLGVWSMCLGRGSSQMTTTWHISFIWEMAMNTKNLENFGQAEISSIRPWSTVALKESPCTTKNSIRIEFFFYWFETSYKQNIRWSDAAVLKRQPISNYNMKWKVSLVRKFGKAERLLNKE